jgi:hypothetical protein
MKSGDNRITIELPKGLKLVAERNIDPEYQNEIYVGIETPDGIWHQDLVVIRNAYSIDDNLIVNWNPGKFEVLVYANKDDVDYTNIFSVELRDDEEQLSLPPPNRYQDKKTATRNSIEAVGQANFSQRELHGKNCNKIQDMLWKERNINWNDFPTDCKRGSCCIKTRITEAVSVLNGDATVEVSRSRWVVDREPPVFTQDREYVERRL